MLSLAPTSTVRHDDNDTENNESVSKTPLPAHVAEGIQEAMALFSCSDRFSSLAAAPTDAAATSTYAWRACMQQCSVLVLLLLLLLLLAAADDQCGAD